MDFNIDHVAKLARLNLKPDEKKKLEKDLDSILEYVKTLSKLDTENVEPTCHVMDLENVFRKDEVKTSDAAKKALEHAPQREGNFFKVPKVVQKD